MYSPPILAAIDAIYIINLPAREDRRQEMTEQLAKINMDLDDTKVTLFPAVRPSGRGAFPSVGAKGCFMSHLGVLKDARARECKNILILEDDANFASSFLESDESTATLVSEGDWDILYFGYDTLGVVPSTEAEDAESLFLQLDSRIELRLAHALMIRQGALEKIIPYFEAMMARPGGDPKGGPMHVDGAYSWFRNDNPDIKTLIAKNQWFNQRSSRTDIHELSWKENIPFINSLRRFRNIF